MAITLSGPVYQCRVQLRADYRRRTLSGDGVDGFGRGYATVADLYGGGHAGCISTGPERFRTVSDQRVWIVTDNSSEAWEILRLGIPGGLTFFFEVATFSLAVVIVGWLGEDRLAAHQIAINMASVTYMMATGISSAAAIRVSAAMGSKAGKGHGGRVWRPFCCRSVLWA